MKRASPSLLALYLLFFASACLAQDDPSAVAKAQQRASATVQAHVNWTKQTSPGATIRAEESSNYPGAVQYRLFVSGLPTDTTYTAVSWPVNAAPAEVMHGITIGKDGVLTCAGSKPEQCGDPGKPDDPIDFIFHPQKGEPYRLLFMAEHDPQSRAAIVLVPDRIEAEDKGCSLTAVRLTPKFELSYISGSGFGPNAQVSFDTHSWNEKHEIPARADANGNLQLTLLNGVVGHDRGLTAVKVVAPDCSPSIEFEWGPVNLRGGRTADQQGQSNQDASCESAPTPPVDMEWLQAQRNALAAIDPLLVADIRRLFDLQGLRKTLERTIPAQLKAGDPAAMALLSCFQNPEEVARLIDARMSAQLTSDEMIDLYVLVFGRHSSREEAESVLASYQSSGDKKGFRKAAAIYSDLQIAGHEYMARIVIPRAVAEVQKELAPRKQD